MTTSAQKLLEQALTLPVSDRAELAAKLLATLEDREQDVEAAWPPRSTNVQPRHAKIPMTTKFGVWLSNVFNGKSFRVEAGPLTATGTARAAGP